MVTYIRILSFFCLIGFTIFSWSAQAADLVELQGINLSYPKTGGVQLTLSADKPFYYKSFKLPKDVAYDKPPRLVIDAFDSNPRFYLDEGFQKQFERDLILKKIRVGKYHDGFTRIVIDLRQDVINNIQERQTSSGGFQLVVEFLSGNARASEESSSQLKAPEAPSQLITPLDIVDLTQEESTQLSSNFDRGEKPVTIVIDAGHGGRDPGAVAQNQKIYEKDITFSIASKLVRQLEKRPGYKPVLTRSADVLIALKKRVAIAHQQKADIFISIHADSAPYGSKPHGASAYVLSKDKSSNLLTKLLADKENSVDKLYSLNGLESINDKETQFIVRNLQLTSLETASERLARILLDQLETIKPLFDRSVQKGNFAVLSSAYVPSVLLEVGFLSNYEEAQAMIKQDRQIQIASVIAQGIDLYVQRFLEKPTPAVPKFVPAKPKPKPTVFPVVSPTDAIGKRNIEVENSAEIGGVIDPAVKARSVKKRVDLLEQLALPNKQKTHLVKERENFLSISRQYNISEQKLKDANSKFRSIIFPGDELVIPE